MSSSLLQVLPPPNVTGALHIGHALTAAIQVGIVTYFKFLYFFPVDRLISLVKKKSNCLLKCPWHGERCSLWQL